MNENKGPFDARDRRRVRIELKEGHMDVCVSEDVSEETLTALRQIGEAALAQMQASEPHGSCLICGHDKPFGVWHESETVGVCRDCRDAASACAQAFRGSEEQFVSHGFSGDDPRYSTRNWRVAIEGDNDGYRIEAAAYALRQLLWRAARREAPGC